MSRIPIRQRGAALLAAMLTVTLVATFASTAMWQQWRAIEIEAGGPARVGWRPSAPGSNRHGF